MISRYSRKELTSIWSEENKYKIWLDVELAAAQAMEKLGQIPKGVSSIVRKKAKINVKRIHQIESQVKHCLLYTSPSPRDVEEPRMPSSA